MRCTECLLPLDPGSSPFTHSVRFFFLWRTVRIGPGLPPLGGFMITFRHIKLSGTPLSERSAPRRDLCLATRHIHKRQTSMPPAGFEPVFPASERPQTHAVGRATIGIGCYVRIWRL